MYRVLARKYRPTNFDTLIGQEVLVRTLTNAFASERIAHAFLLTGIRGIGKTTTARIIARGLNCIGADGNGGPTTSPCGVCPNCTMLAADRHVDVMEMDAASHTGVDDIRSIIESVQYAPVTGRYKIYIIDEVHMLSKSAFNALLKTLEEPPPHVKFIFATTEIRKIPVTIVSRCQRFDLRRVDGDVLAQHLIDVSTKESVSLPQEAAMLIAAAAEGSVRDSLSMLDQAIAMHTDASGVTTITAESVRDMLGIADKTHVFEVLAQMMRGETEAALMQVNRLYKQGADPAMFIADLMEVVHYLTRILSAPALAADVHYSAREQALASTLAQSLSIPALARAWQLLLKGAEEMRHAEHALGALEMLVVRLGYAAQLPSPAALIAQLQSGASLMDAPPPRSAANTSSAAPSIRAAESASVTALPPLESRAAATPAYAPVARSATALALQSEPAPSLAKPGRFEEVVALFEQHKEPLLYAHLMQDLELVSCTLGTLQLHPISYLAPDVPVRLQRRLNEWTGMRWNIEFVPQRGQPTLAQQAKDAKAKALEVATNHPLVQQVLQHFPNAEIIEFIPNPE